MAPIQGPDGDFSGLRAARSRKSMRQVEGDDFLSLSRATALSLYQRDINYDKIT